jgi:hypothetical protein
VPTLHVQFSIPHSQLTLQIGLVKEQSSNIPLLHLQNHSDVVPHCVLKFQSSSYVPTLHVQFSIPHSQLTLQIGLVKEQSSNIPLLHLQNHSDVVPHCVLKFQSSSYVPTLHVQFSIPHSQLTLQIGLVKEQSSNIPLLHLQNHSDVVPHCVLKFQSSSYVPTTLHVQFSIPHSQLTLQIGLVKEQSSNIPLLHLQNHSDVVPHCVLKFQSSSYVPTLHVQFSIPHSQLTLQIGLVKEQSSNIPLLHLQNHSDVVPHCVLKFQSSSYVPTLHVQFSIPHSQLTLQIGLVKEQSSNIPLLHLQNHSDVVPHCVLKFQSSSYVPTLHVQFSIPHSQLTLQIGLVKEQSSNIPLLHLQNHSDVVPHCVLKFQSSSYVPTLHVQFSIPHSQLTLHKSSDGRGALQDQSQRIVHGFCSQQLLGTL